MEEPPRPVEPRWGVYQDQWDELEKEFHQLEAEHKIFSTQLDSVKKLGDNCAKGVKHQEYRLSQLKEAVSSLSRDGSSQSRDHLQRLVRDVSDRKKRLYNMMENLPRSNGRYLGVILGPVNLALTDKKDKLEYKKNYESFKLSVTSVIFLFSVTLQFFNYRFLDSAFTFLLVWYYCTLTIREQVLIVNGSRVKGWWVAHHFLSTCVAGLCLTWPDSESFHKFRPLFASFNAYLAVVQTMQCYYQRGIIHRLTTLGQSHSMDISVEGFMSWMWKGLTFMLPFLLSVYVLQFYTGVTLIYMAQEEYCHEWQVAVLACLFLILSLGNMFTTGRVILAKVRNRAETREALPSKALAGPHGEKKED